MPPNAALIDSSLTPLLHVKISQTLVGGIVPMRERGRYQGLFTSAFAASSVAGPLLGGFINPPTGVLAMCL